MRKWEQPAQEKRISEETLAEGQLRTTQQDVAEFFSSIECGARSSQPPVNGGVEASQAEE